VDVSQNLGVSHQQLQKYEQGSSRIAAVTLLQISKILRVSVNYFYNGYDTIEEAQGSSESLLNCDRKNSLNVLIAESDPADERLIREAIHDAGKPVNIYTLRDGEQVLDLLKKRRGMSRLPRPDIIFIELALPKVNGLQLLREIKRDRNIQDIPIIVMSYGLQKKDLTDCYKNHAGGYIHKDCTFSRFKSQIKDSINYWSTVCLPNM
jgi:CheY-like chemotaxis protein